ncbi:MAG: hypothetical protein Q4D91_06835 [Lautropia sp.]|nr:hypothetical protein [Lautropia sp.]
MAGKPCMHGAGLAGRTAAVWVMVAAFMSLAQAAEYPRKEPSDKAGASQAALQIALQAGKEGALEGVDSASAQGGHGKAGSQKEKAKGQNAGRDRIEEKRLTGDEEEVPERKPMDQGALLLTQSAAGQVKVKSWKTLRDDGIVKQDLDYSCGAASAATLLNSFYGQKISEKQFLKAMGRKTAWPVLRTWLGPCRHSASRPGALQLVGISWSS